MLTAPDCSRRPDISKSLQMIPDSPDINTEFFSGKVVFPARAVASVCYQGCSIAWMMSDVASQRSRWPQMAPDVPTAQIRWHQIAPDGRIPCTGYHARDTMHGILCTGYHAYHARDTMRGIPQGYHRDTTGYHRIHCKMQCFCFIALDQWKKKCFENLCFILFCVW